MRLASHRVRILTVVIPVLAVLIATAFQPAAAGSRPWHLPSWHLLDTGTDSHFRGLAAVSRSVAWLGGYDGTVLRTTDGGRTWSDVSPAGAGTLQFRDINAFDATHAVAMAAGGGTDSRLYVTADGGQTWHLAYENHAKAAFFDCMSFFDPRHGLVLSDPVAGRFRILSTSDGGNTWTVLPNAGMPPAHTGEFGFAASGECLTTSGHDAWFGTGGSKASHVYHSRDGGQTWAVTTTPIVSGDSAGVIGLAFRTPLVGIAVGGDFDAPAKHAAVAADSFFGGPWQRASSMPGGYRSGVAFLPRLLSGAISVGLNGSDISLDFGRHWTRFGRGQFDTVACTHDGSCWASGDLGRVAVLRYRDSGITDR